MRKSKFIYILAFVLVLSACTAEFEEANTNPVQISQESLKQDFNFIGAYFPTMLANVLVSDANQQVGQNLTSDSWAQYLAPPTPFAGGINNTTYKMTWKDRYWNMVYQRVMPSARKVEQLAADNDYPVFGAWAKLVRILAIERLASYHGPLIYSQYGIASAKVPYDSEQQLYTKIFAELDEINTVFSANKTYPGLKNFDATGYAGDVNKWIKVVNSVRLRLAMRISKIDPTIAKTEAEKAYTDAGGLILANANNFQISLYGSTPPLVLFCFSWGDTRMSAAMESFLVGLKDNRIEKYFSPVADASLVTDHPDFPYKGIRNGALLAVKDHRTPFSSLNESFKNMTHQKAISAAEVMFLLAEAKLRGWNVGTKTVENYYEEAVALSFAQWGAGGVDAYLADATSTPINYNDPKETGDVNDFVSRSTVTVAWNEADNNELKLEKIITQKWIAGFPNSVEAWVDFRRTGYPKLPYVYKNDSGPDDGVIAADEFIKRMKFVPAEYTSNPDAVADAVKTLSNQKDEIGTRLWWDTGTANFPTK